MRFRGIVILAICLYGYTQRLSDGCFFVSYVFVRKEKE